MDISPVEIRMRCIEAASRASFQNPHNILNLAEAMVTFVQGHSGARGHVAPADVLDALDALATQGKHLMSTVLDIQRAQRDMLAEVESNTNAVSAVTRVVQNMQAQIGALQAQLQNAGGDQAVIDDVVAGMQQIKGGLDAQAVALAALSNTGAPVVVPAANTGGIPNSDGVTSSPGAAVQSSANPDSAGETVPAGSASNDKPAAVSGDEGTLPSTDGL